MESARIKIDRLAPGGDGIGTLEGKISFVPYSLPEEKILCRKIEDRKNYSRWLPAAVETPSPYRQEPPCPYHFQPGMQGIWCGGCDWQHIKIEEQRKWKKELVRETLRRLGGFENPQVQEIIFAPDAFRYRNKVQIPFAPRKNAVIPAIPVIPAKAGIHGFPIKTFGNDGRMDSCFRRNDVPSKGFAAGFYAPGSHDIVEFEDCLVQPELSLKIFRAVNNFAAAKNWEAYDKDNNRGWLRHLVIRTNSDGEALVVLVTRSGQFDDGGAFEESLRAACTEVKGIFQNLQPEQSNVILGARWVKLWGADRLREKIGGLEIYFSPGAFMQVNTPAAELLYREALSLAEMGSDWTLLDLYCGVGVMALMAAKKLKRAVGVEEVPISIEDAMFNARMNKISNVIFVKASVEEFFRKNFGRSSFAFNPEKLAVILDPPRAGCKPEVIHRLLEFEPARVVYVSCDPATLARDLKLLSRKYSVEKVVPVDLFPQTSHIETIVSMGRR